MGARSSPGAEETIHGPVAYPGRGPGDCETPRVSTRSRTAAVLLPLLLVGPVLLPGCAEGGRSQAASSSSVSGEEPSDGAVTTSAAADTVEDGTSEAPDFPADTEATPRRRLWTQR